MVKKTTLSDRPRYSVFVRFRRTRLTLRRGIESLETAIAFAEGARRLRFHQQDDILIVREPDGVIIEGSALGSSAGAPTSDQPVEAPPLDGESAHRDGLVGDAASGIALSIGARPSALSPESVESAAEAHHRRLWRIEALRQEAERACARFEPILAQALGSGALTADACDELQRLHQTLQAFGVELRAVALEERRIDTSDQAREPYEWGASTDRRDDPS